MTFTGTVESVRRTRSKAGSPYARVVVDGRTFRYLATFTAIPARGDRVTISGMLMVGFDRVNIGAAHITIHPTTESDNK